MITLDLFKKAISTIQKLEEDNKKLSDILINDSSCGFCDFGGELIQTFLDVLHADFNMFDEDPILEWWLYEVDDGIYRAFENQPRYQYSGTKVSMFHTIGLYERG